MKKCSRIMQLINYIDKFYYCKDVNEEMCAVYFGMQKNIVRVNNFLFFEERVSSGIPQRSILGFLQFLFYLNDLPDVVNPDIP